MKAAFDDGLARRTSGLADEASDLAAQSQEHEAAARADRAEADGLDPDDPRVIMLHELAQREQGMADSDLVGAEAADEERVVVASMTAAEVEEARDQRVSRKCSSYF